MKYSTGECSLNLDLALFINHRLDEKRFVSFFGSDPTILIFSQKALITFGDYFGYIFFGSQVLAGIFISLNNKLFIFSSSIYLCAS